MTPSDLRTLHESDLPQLADAGLDAAGIVRTDFAALGHRVRAVCA